ncbi:pyrophosphate--fructose 6-phosphate 1-phosphotransferase [Syntrophus aciditrophicus SB]|uniref:ATP-dependent 6-phosphofructokinase n=2 Tax=Syntrophus TaxID=43773 RepID=Q2LRC5_SYNAS|nr:pyrophosphate--fructose 6-phosphate 1-phosphotransferase [Syntrophus aciditrophicus SB]
MRQEGDMGNTELDFTIERLGECHIPSPVKGIRFVDDDGRVLYHSHLQEMKPWLDEGIHPPAMEAAGPREKVFFDPSRIACGIVTCGGICPGLNDVIRSIVLSLCHHYCVQKIYGFRFGYEGLVQRYGHKPLELTADSVAQIHEIGGTILGSSRGPQEPSEMVKTLEDLNVGILFTIGGDGTQRGAQKIAEEATRRGLEISVIGIPKTIDNDISYIQATFGFETAVAEARRATYAAHTEADAARNSISLVKLMGRDSGFIAAYSVLVNSHVNFCLVPEARFTLDGLLRALKERLERRGHAVVVVAEGAGQNLMEATAERDASGNIKYGDIGIFLRDAIRDYFRKASLEINLKYIDPSYIIRSMPANPHDAAFCLLLGQSAVHAGMSGRTNMVVSFWNREFTHVPITLAVSQRKKIDTSSMLWNSVLAVTGQPDMM